MSVIVLWVSNFDKSIPFYEQLFNTSCSYRSDEFAAVGAGPNEVLLHLLPEQYRDQPSYGEDNPIKPVFTLEQAPTHDAFGNSPLQTHEGWSYQDGLDPDGHVIQVRFRLN